MLYDENAYAKITPAEILERLEHAGIRVTSQTLRNWEKYGLITPAVRKNNKLRGRSAFYYEYVLAECYAVYQLSHGVEFSRTMPPVPKFSMAHIQIARQIFYEQYAGRIRGYPPAPKQFAPELNNNFPNYDFSSRKRSFFISENRNDYIVTSMGETIMDLLANAWIVVLTAGCEKFLRTYKERRYFYDK